MNSLSKISTALLLLLLTTISVALAQDDDGKLNPGKGFHVGIYVGSFFANNYNASLYDGYGIDFDGFKNTFENSFMYNKIWQEYGAHNNTSSQDQIAQALSTGGQVVQHDGWSFTEDDMPLQMRYRPAIMLGLACRYFVDKKNTLIFNLNVTKLTAEGAFTITIPNAIYQNQRVQTFSIIGGEQRMMFNLGYQRILGNNEKLNFLIEAGINFSLAKFDKNQVQINNLTIDLTGYYDQFGQVTTLPFQRPVGFGIGAFGGAGFNLTLGGKWTAQLLYSPTYENLNFGFNSALKLHNGVGLRAYYSL